MKCNGVVLATQLFPKKIYIRMAVMEVEIVGGSLLLNVFMQIVLIILLIVSWRSTATEFPLLLLYSLLYSYMLLLLLYVDFYKTPLILT